MSIWNHLGCKNCFVGVVSLGFFLVALPTNIRAAAAPTRLVIGYASTTPRLMPLWMARDQGFFAKYGIESEPVLLRSGATLVTGMASKVEDVVDNRIMRKLEDSGFIEKTFAAHGASFK